MIQFVFVYITEAHAVDEWPIGSDIVVKQPKTIDERKKICKQFIEHSNWDQTLIPMYLDEIQNHFDDTYAAWPVRFYIVQEEKMQYIAEPIGESYSMEILEEEINKTIQKTG